MRTKQMKTINNITPFLARFFYLITYKILGLFTYLKSHSEITLINAFQLGSTIAGIQSVLNKCRPSSSTLLQWPTANNYTEPSCKLIGLKARSPLASPPIPTGGRQGTGSQSVTFSSLDSW